MHIKSKNKATLHKWKPKMKDFTKNLAKMSCKIIEIHVSYNVGSLQEIR